MISLSEIYNIYLSCSGVTIDTRKLIAGQLFVAIKGPNFDGNAYAEAALDKGAAKVIVDDPSVVKNENYILVADSLKALQDLATYHRQQLQIPVLGITGSNGKTTTKELLQAVLSTTFRVSATAGNYNNHIGVPLTLLNADPAAEILIVEMGTNQKGDIDFLCEMAAPTAGIITNIGFAHLEKLIDQEGVFQEKSSLFQHVDDSMGVIFRNVDDAYLKNYKHRLSELINYNRNGFHSTQIQSNQGESEYLKCSVLAGAQEYILNSKLVGTYNLLNISAALCVGDFYGVPIDEAIQAISDYHPDNMRSQLITTERNSVVIDAYNANPSSMSESISAFLKSEGKGRVLILGDMLELGEQAEHFHQEILRMSAISGAEKIILVGDIFSAIANNYNSYKRVEDLMSSGTLEQLKDKSILVKGSRGIQLEKVLPHL